jgi:hypothetical protein
MLSCIGVRIISDALYSFWNGYYMFDVVLDILRLSCCVCGSCGPRTRAHGRTDRSDGQMDGRTGAKQKYVSRTGQTRQTNPCIRDDMFFVQGEDLAFVQGK